MDFEYTPPPWYSLIVAARYLGVAPWELEKQPTWWRDRALIVKQAEQRADSILRKMHKQMQESQEYLS